MGDPKAHVMARPLRAPLRRSFSDHIRDSTARALDVIWKNTRDRRLAEIEAKEACDWLRATGFPQYAQLYEDFLFPIDISLVKREHDFLDRDAIEALCR
ncbi:rho GTPase-activating protein 7-like [Macaca thibetana thibetana]|nr:rho GTPase-activating protein 7-like [Macaca thibetana thibetana]